MRACREKQNSIETIFVFIPVAQHSQSTTLQSPPAINLFYIKGWPPRARVGAVRQLERCKRGMQAKNMPVMTSPT